jgi:hypothetical protein
MVSGRVICVMGRTTSLILFRENRVAFCFYGSGLQRFATTHHTEYA